MRSERMLLGMLIGLALPATPTLAQTSMSCGSTGADGALVVPQGQTVTLDIPDSGVFNYTTVTVSGQLLFRRSARFNPPVMLLATGDIVIDSGDSVRVNGTNGSTFSGGSGGPGGLDGGSPGIAGGLPGAGHGPGAGGAGIGSLVAGNGAYGGDPISSHSTDGVVYGSPLLIPLAGGSGGGGDTNAGGAGGGGAILFCSPTQVVVNGAVDAIGGGSSTVGSGSGGAIRIVSPVVRGTGSLNVTGGAGWGGHGRVRIDVIDRSGLVSLTTSPASALSVASFMAVSAGPTPRLHIVHVAGNDIPPGTPSPLVFTLPFNSPARHSITVRAEGFAGTVPITVVVTPDSGNPIVVNTDIDTSLSPAEATVEVDLPQNITVKVHAWTR